MRIKKGEYVDTYHALRVYNFPKPTDTYDYSHKMRVRTYYSVGLKTREDRLAQPVPACGFLTLREKVVEFQGVKRFSHYKSAFPESQLSGGVFLKFISTSWIFPNRGADAPFSRDACVAFGGTITMK